MVSCALWVPNKPNDKYKEGVGMSIGCSIKCNRDGKFDVVE